MHNRNLVFFYFRSSLRAREHAAEALREAQTASKPATKVELCRIHYAELCGIMLNYAELCGIVRIMRIMRNYAFSSRIVHLQNRLSPDNEDN